MYIRSDVLLVGIKKTQNGSHIFCLTASCGSRCEGFILSSSISGCTDLSWLNKEAIVNLGGEGEGEGEKSLKS